jgi:hypothetical protein
VDWDYFWRTAYNAFELMWVFESLFEPLEAEDTIDRLSIRLVILGPLLFSFIDFLLIEKEDIWDGGSSPFDGVVVCLVTGFLKVFLILASILPIIELGFLGPC